MMSPKILFARALARLDALFGRGLVVTMAWIGALGVALSLAAFLFFNTAAPRSVTISGGPPGSSFERYAERYRKILAREGVTLKVLPSDGSSDNLRRLADAKSDAEAGFVLAGEAGETKYDRLVSLGAVAYQPLMIFYSGPPRTLLAEFRGARINIGPPGSGTHRLGLALLKANGIVPGEGTRIDESDLEDPGRELRAGRLDAIVLMSESTASKVARELMRDPAIRVYDFVQADAYVRRHPTLNRLQLPRGAIDLGADIPPADVHLVGPTVHLVARESLHPALSDLLLEAAREVHGGAGIYRKRGEFPVAQEGEFRVSPDATRYYASGKSFLYRSFPFWLASLIARILAVLVPVVLVLLPALRMAPAIYRWRIESKIYRWYRVLLELERDAFRDDVGPERREELLRQLDHIESAVSRIVIPATFGDLFYGLRGHIGFVRNLLQAGHAVAAAGTARPPAS